MEEILASIRKIIADDDALPPSGPAPGARTAFPPPHLFGKAAPMETAAPPVHAADLPADSEQKALVVAIEPGAETLAVNEEKAAPAQDPVVPTPAQSIELDESELASFEEIALELSGERAPRRGIQSAVTSLAEAAPEQPEETRVCEEPLAEEDAFAPQPESRISVASSRSEPHIMLSAQADASISSAFRALSASVQLTNSEMIERHVRDLLRPMLKQWLDDNLPVMVERLVRAEIERVARGGR